MLVSLYDVLRTRQSQTHTGAIWQF